MRTTKIVARSAAFLIGAAWITLGPLQANAAGDTARFHGCAAHWRVTATWNECVDDAGQPVRVQLNTRCDAEPDWEGAYKLVEGRVDPLDRHGCRFQAQEAYNEFRQP